MAVESPAPRPAGDDPVRSGPGRLPRAIPELLAPAGDWDCARAAVENGADAIYFGLDKFNARMRADNFTEADLPPLMEFLHRRGVRGYVTLNTLVFENELDDASRYVRTMIAAGVDAVIVQDVGVCRLIRELSPDFPIHASTQMSITSAAGVAFARDLGCQLVVLARELSIRDIEHIRSETGSSESMLPLEVFVHGALCVAYSGQCLTSEALGGRSANRGECAQACRLPYELVADGQAVPLGDRRYLLSPQDLAGLDVLPDLVRSGVASLKIEGRLKSPEYVANITQIYRQALDRLRSAGPPESVPPIPRYELEMAFSRGLHTGWFDGVDHQALVHARFGKKRGVYLGRVTGVAGDQVTVRLEGGLKPGDGVVFDAGNPEGKEEGGRVYGMRNAERGTRTLAVLTFGNGVVDFGRVRVGDRVWKTSDPVLEKRWRRSYQGEMPRFQRPIAMEVHGVASGPLTLLARDIEGHVARAESSVALVQARTHPLTTDRLRHQLGRLGGTPFKLGELANHLSGQVMLPLSDLNRLRRCVVAELERLRSQPKRWTLRDITGPLPLAPEHAGAHRGATAIRRGDPVAPPGHAECRLIILVRDLPQLEAALNAGAAIVYCDFENPKRYRDAVASFRQWQQTPSFDPGPKPHSAFRDPHSAIFVSPPRIFRPGEEWQLEQVRSSGADGYLVRNHDHLRFFAKDRCVGDFSLNVANRLSAEYFRKRFGLERVTASYDLNFRQLEALLGGAPPEWFEITLHQHMPMFHMEHCVFAAFLSSGRDYRDCGRPCENHSVRLRDRVGAAHPVKADIGCRNTVFNARAQTGAEYAGALMALGVRWFRLEFLDESPAEVARTMAMYRDLLRGRLDGGQLWRELKLINQLGVTRGTVGR